MNIKRMKAGAAAEYMAIMPKIINTTEDLATLLVQDDVEGWAAYSNEGTLMGCCVLADKTILILEITPLFRRLSYGWQLIKHVQKYRDELQICLSPQELELEAFWKECGFWVERENKAGVVLKWSFGRTIFAGTKNRIAKYFTTS